MVTVKSPWGWVYFSFTHNYSLIIAMCQGFRWGPHPHRSHSKVGVCSLHSGASPLQFQLDFYVLDFLASLSCLDLSLGWPQVQSPPGARVSHPNYRDLKRTQGLPPDSASMSAWREAGSGNALELSSSQNPIHALSILRELSGLIDLLA